MLIVAKLPTKDDKRRVTRSCQRRCHYDELKAAEARESKANTGARRVPQKVGAPLKELLMKGCHQEHVSAD